MSPVPIEIYEELSPAVGFEMGYALSSEVFYIRLAGILPEHREEGIARHLMSEQHRLLNPRVLNCSRKRSLKTAIKLCWLFHDH